MFIYMCMWGMLCECVYYILVTYMVMYVYFCVCQGHVSLCALIYIYVIHTCISVYKDKIHVLVRECACVCVRSLAPTCLSVTM